MHPFEAQLFRDWPPRRWQGHGLVLAVSGGADSVALLHALASLRRSLSRPTRLVVAHFHHGWRGLEADADQQFVAQLADRLDVPFVTEKGPGQVSTGGQGPEATGRRLRYDFLLRTAQNRGARYVVTAHNADDQVETVLHRILRGTGVEGLAGICRVRRLTAEVALIRPLLARKRTEIEQYLRDLNECFRTDESNADPRYMRNRIRRQLLPELRSSFQPQVDAALMRLADDARSYAHALQCLVHQHEARVVENTSHGVRIDRASFQTMNPLLQCVLLRNIWRQRGWPQQNMSRRRWHELAELVAQSPPTSRQFPGAVDLLIESAQTAQLSRSSRVARS